MTAVDLDTAVKKMGREPLNPIGKCFDSSAHQMLNDPIPNALMCHGIGIANMPGQEGDQMAHAWLEADGIAYDTTWGAKVEAKAYRTILRLRYVVQYSRKEFLIHWKSKGYPGPWDRSLKKLIAQTKGIT